MWRTQLLRLLAATALVACGNGPSVSSRAGAGGISSESSVTSPAPGGAFGSGNPGGPGAPSSVAPSAPVPTGTVAFRVANFMSSAADVCLKGDDGAWIGPLFHGVATTSLGPRAVSERIKIQNSHFVARIVDATCAQGRGADVTLPLVGGGWSATLLLGDAGGTPSLRLVVDDLSVSDTASFVRLVDAGSWSTGADLGMLDVDGNFVALCLKAPYLGVATDGPIDALGYANVDPLDGTTSLVVRSTNDQQPLFQLDGLTTNVDANYTLFAYGAANAPGALLCDDEAPPNRHLAKCTTVR